MTLDRLARGGHVHAADVQRLAFREDACPRDVEQNPDAVRRPLGEPDHVIDLIGAARTAIDHRRHAIGQTE